MELWQPLEMLNPEQPGTKLKVAWKGSEDPQGPSSSPKSSFPPLALLCSAAEAQRMQLSAIQRQGWLVCRAQGPHSFPRKSWWQTTTVCQRPPTQPSALEAVRPLHSAPPPPPLWPCVSPRGVGKASQEDAAPLAIPPLPQGTHLAGRGPRVALQPLSQAAAHQDIILKGRTTPPQEAAAHSPRSLLGEVWEWHYLYNLPDPVAPLKTSPQLLLTALCRFPNDPDSNYYLLPARFPTLCIFYFALQKAILMW